MITKVIILWYQNPTIPLLGVVICFYRSSYLSEPSPTTGCWFTVGQEAPAPTISPSNLRTVILSLSTSWEGDRSSSSQLQGIYVLIITDVAFVFEALLIKYAFA